MLEYREEILAIAWTHLLRKRLTKEANRNVQLKSKEDE
jgi:hypothetical protein